jgi:hypothetical protein
MSIPFNEIVMPDKPKTKEQILEEMRRTYKPASKWFGEIQDEDYLLEMFEDLPF